MGIEQGGEVGVPHLVALDAGGYAVHDQEEQAVGLARRLWQRVDDAADLGGVRLVEPLERLLRPCGAVEQPLRVARPPGADEPLEQGGDQVQVAVLGKPAGGGARCRRCGCDRAASGRPR